MHDSPSSRQLDVRASARHGAGNHPGSPRGTRWTLLVSRGLIAVGAAFVALAAGHYASGDLAQARAPARPGHPGRFGLRPPAPGEPIARLRIPSIHLDAAVLEGTSAAVLRMGPGHLEGTGPPGRSGGYNNCVIAGHRDSFFRRLDAVREGDRLALIVGNEERRYRVVRRRIVPPSDIAVAGPTLRPRVTLITCYPFHWIGPAPYRFVLEAEALPGRPLPSGATTAASSSLASRARATVSR